MLSGQHEKVTYTFDMLATLRAIEQYWFYIVKLLKSLNLVFLLNDVDRQISLRWQNDDLVQSSFDAPKIVTLITIKAVCIC